MLLGSCLGSFLNVCIHRIPAKLSVVFPSSHCPHCKKNIKPWHNVPILSYLILKGKCSSCLSKISFRYPLVEIITPISLLIIYLRFGLSVEFIQYSIFSCLGIIVFFIDYAHHIIPDILSILIILNGFIFLLFKDNFLAYIIGGVAGFLFFFTVAYLFFLINHKEGLGGGDIKLIAGIGLNVSWLGVVFTVLTGSLLALFYALIIKVKRGQEFSFGPFLVIGSYFYLVFGYPVIEYYLSFF